MKLKKSILSTAVISCLLFTSGVASALDMKCVRLIVHGAAGKNWKSFIGDERGLIGPIWVSLDANGKRSIDHQFSGNRVLVPARSSKTFSQCVLSPKDQPVNDEIDFAYYPADQSQPTTGHMQNACLGFIDSTGVHVLEYAHNCHLDAADNLYLGKAS